MSVGFHYDSFQSAQATLTAADGKATLAVGKPVEVVRIGFTANTAIVVPVGGFSFRGNKKDADLTSNVVLGITGACTQPASTNIAVNFGIYHNCAPVKLAQHQVLTIEVTAAATSGTGFFWVHYRPLDSHAADTNTFAQGNLMGQYTHRAT